MPAVLAAVRIRGVKHATLQPELAKPKSLSRGVCAGTTMVRETAMLTNLLFWIQAQVQVAVPTMSSHPVWVSASASQATKTLGHFMLQAAIPNLITQVDLFPPGHIQSRQMCLLAGPLPAQTMCQ
ncbi:MAG: hypothetical protein A2958_02450 [Candidatus Levybacteria bacterium RIFCSPLOWO2_01_FULL_38_13]|nr:MAG: hypothetical protein A2629_04080 [Candidatus Levybacteria bacterium RIFCSPHIGHO2_01_FULL_41_15]OGH35110.1 MAG: hypothetical protein A2958_02450 [Candidatus Levybacteria bacterium RIFCSPLOWO2_01_FULL_38_13]